MGDVWKTPVGILSTLIHGDDDVVYADDNCNDDEDLNGRLPFLPPHSCALSLSAAVKPLYSSSLFSFLSFLFCRCCCCYCCCYFLVLFHNRLGHDRFSVYYDHESPFFGTNAFHAWSFSSTSLSSSSLSKLMMTMVLMIMMMMVMMMMMAMFQNMNGMPCSASGQSKFVSRLFMSPHHLSPHTLDSNKYQEVPRSAKYIFRHFIFAFAFHTRL